MTNPSHPEGPMSRCPICGARDPLPSHVAFCTVLDEQQEAVRKHAAEFGIKALYVLDLHAHFNSRVGDPAEAARLASVVIDLGWRPTIPEAKESK